MSEHNFNSFKNLEVPEKWVNGALNVPPEQKKAQPILLYRAVAVAACLMLLVGIGCAVFFFSNADKTASTATQSQADSKSKEAEIPDLFPAKTDLFDEQNPSTNSEISLPTSTDNLCVGEFSDDLVVGDKNIYCVIYNYKTGEPLGDENLFSSEHLAQIEYNDDGTVTATYDPVKAGVVKKTGEYWYVFYNELVMSPVQNYIFIYI